jgi:hypothetical protein
MQERLVYSAVIASISAAIIFAPYVVGRIILYINKKDHRVAPPYVCWVFGFCCSAIFISALSLLVIWIQWIIKGN